MKDKNEATLRFLGATDTVTGSRYLLDSGGQRILIDCGLFQGFKRIRVRNRAPFPVPPASIDAVLLTHAHLDHTGCQRTRIPMKSSSGCGQFSVLHA